MTGAAPKPSGRELARVAGGLILFYIVGLILSVVLVTWSARLFGWRLDAEALTLAEVLAQGFLQLLVFALLSVVLVRVLRPPPGTDWRIGPKGAAPGFALGLGLGSVLAATAMLLATALGSAAWTADAGSLGDYVRSVVVTLVALAPAALAEEVAFRGAPMVLLSRVTSRGTAIVVLAVGFALIHLQNPGISALAIGNIALAGVFLGLAFFLPGGLWTAWGAHLGWNGALAALDAPVSGLPLRIPLIDFVPSTPTWLSGGTFGPEGGLVATLLLAFGAILIGRRAGRTSA